MDQLFTSLADLGSRIVDNFAGRVSGPMKFRLVMQPLMAAIFAVRAGLLDGRTGQPPYFWAMFGSKSHRRELLRQGWKDVGKIFVLAVAIDVVYQIIVLRWVYPGEALAVAALLAFIPYLLIRGPVTRLTPERKSPPDRRTERGAA